MCTQLYIQTIYIVNMLFCDYSLCSNIVFDLNDFYIRTNLSKILLSIATYTHVMGKIFFIVANKFINS